MIGQDFFFLGDGEVVVGHDLGEFAETDFRFPTEHATGLAEIAMKVIDFAGPEEFRIDDDVVLPIQIEVAENFVEKLPH